jgi:hypothetical protein
VPNGPLRRSPAACVGYHSQRFNAPRRVESKFWTTAGTPPATKFAVTEGDHDLIGLAFDVRERRGSAEAW